MQAEEITPRLFFVGVTAIQHLKSKLDAEQNSQNIGNNFELVYVQAVEELIKTYHGDGIKFIFRPFTDVDNHHGYFIIRSSQIAQCCLILANEFTSEYNLQIWEGCSIIVKEEPVGITKETAYFIDLTTLKGLIKSLEHPSSQILPNSQSEEKELETVYKLTTKHLPRILSAFRRKAFEFSHFGSFALIKFTGHPNPYDLSSTSFRNLLLPLTNDHLVRVYRVVDLEFINNLSNLNPSIQSTTIPMENNQPPGPPFMGTLPPNFYQGPGIIYHPPPQPPPPIPSNGYIAPERVPIYPHQMQNMHPNFPYPPPQPPWMTQNIPPYPIYQAYPYPPPIPQIEYPQQPVTSYSYTPQTYHYPPPLPLEVENPPPPYFPPQPPPPPIIAQDSTTDQEHIEAVNNFLNKCGKRKNIPPAPPPPIISGRRSKSRSKSRSPTPTRLAPNRSQGEDLENESINQRRNSKSESAKEKSISNSKFESKSRSPTGSQSGSQNSKISRSKSPSVIDKIPTPKSNENRQKEKQPNPKNQRIGEKAENNFPKYKVTELFGEKTIWGNSFSVSFSHNGEKLYVKAKPGISIDDQQLEDILRQLEKAFASTSTQITQTETIVTKVPALKAAPQFGKRFGTKANNLNPSSSKSFGEKVTETEINLEKGQNAIGQVKNVQSQNKNVMEIDVQGKQDVIQASNSQMGNKVQQSKIVKEGKEQLKNLETNAAKLDLNSSKEIKADVISAQSSSKEVVAQKTSSKVTSLAEMRLRQMKKMEEFKNGNSRK